MRLFNYTIIFFIIFGTMVFITDRKAYLEEKSLERQIMFENACSDGVKAAAQILSAESNGISCSPDEVEKAFFKAMAARLGVEAQPFYQQKLEWYVPIICILHKDSYELVYSSFDETGKYNRRSHGRHTYTYSETETAIILNDENADTCVRIIEEEIDSIIAGWLFKEGEAEVFFDLPEHTSNAFVRNISGPTILAISADRAFGKNERQYAVYAAEVSETREMVIVNNNSRKEWHYSDCEKIQSKKFSRVSDYKEAAALGALPAPCCDPLGAYCFDFCGYN